MIAAAIAALGLPGNVLAQKDAAQKAKEGAIEHWIEYYKAEQRKHSAIARQEPADRPVPTGRTAPGTPAAEKTERR